MQNRPRPGRGRGPVDQHRLRDAGPLLCEPQKALPVGGLLIIGRLGGGQVGMRDGIGPAALDEIQLSQQRVHGEVRASNGQLSLSCNARFVIAGHGQQCGGELRMQEFGSWVAGDGFRVGFGSLGVFAHARVHTTQIVKKCSESPGAKGPGTVSFGRRVLRQAKGDLPDALPQGLLLCGGEDGRIVLSSRESQQGRRVRRCRSRHFSCDACIHLERCSERP